MRHTTRFASPTVVNVPPTEPPIQGVVGDNDLLGRAESELKRITSTQYIKSQIAGTIGAVGSQYLMDKKVNIMRLAEGAAAAVVFDSVMGMVIAQLGPEVTMGLDLTLMRAVGEVGAVYGMQRLTRKIGRDTLKTLAVERFAANGIRTLVGPYV